MTKKRVMVAVAVALAGLSGATLLGTESVASPNEPVDLKSLPANKWTKLPCKPQAGPFLCAPVYVPSRGQLLHWGQTGGWDKPSANDVRAFDAAVGDWVSDYPSDAPQTPGASGLFGQGSMLPSGRPRPAMVLNGVCWDSKREQVVYTMAGLMAAYDPKAKVWKDLKAKTIMPDRTPEHAGDRPTGKLKTEFDGGPPVYGMGTCYDPENDEIILFPHFDAKNISLREATGQITGHLGTFRYSFKDNTWRVVGDTFGSDEVRAARKGLIAIMAKASAAMDAAWVLARKPDAAKATETAKRFEAAAGDLEKLALTAEAKMGLAPVAGLLKSAASALAAGRAEEALRPARDALWAMNEALDGALRVEPPPRCAAPMVYDPKNKCVVMFGGHTSLWRSDGGSGPNVMDGQNDTWLYDVKTRQWRETAAKSRPPLGRFACRVPMLAYDDASGLILSFARTGDIWNAKTPRKAQLWTLDVARGEWSKRLETDWSGELTTMSGQGSESPHSQAPTAMFGYDPKAKLALIVQPEKEGQATYAMRVDLSSLPSEPAPAWTPPTPITPQEIPADDPAWLATLKALPANTWVPAKPPKEPNRRDWGMLAVDPVRGWVVYQGGGHSSWQVNDVSVYAVGANKWAFQAGDHNAYIPPNEWEGNTLGYRGGPRGRHERNTYQALDGRAYNYIGTGDLFQDGTMHLDPGYVRFYDLDRGGVHRELPLAGKPEFANPNGSRGIGAVDPNGRVLYLHRQASGYYARDIVKTVFTAYDIYGHGFTVTDVPKPFPMHRGLGESRAFCYVPDRDLYVLMTSAPKDPARLFEMPKDKEEQRHAIFAYDLKANRFSELPARREPPLKPVQVLEYVPSQKCLLAIIANQQWVYSFGKGDWAELPVRTEGGSMGFQGPYGQMVWVEKYGVFVNTVGRTWVMRPDFSQVK
ncbi:MAG: hypothetical protein FJ290_08950 [Planctomycetes bacterium]|nr:hypothetical protein [Planctomycetota bacterium]